MNDFDRILADVAKAVREISTQGHVTITVEIHAFPQGLTGRRGDAALQIAGGTANVVQINMTNVTNSGTAGIIAGGDVVGSSATVTQTVNSAPAELEKLLKPFANALKTSSLSAGRQGLVKAQLDVIREQASKPAAERDADGVRRALDDVKSAAGAASALKGLWDQFGNQIAGWFDGGGA